ncbi:MAG: hypothetical protein ACKVOB_04505 [Sphingomonas sp.]
MTLTVSTLFLLLALAALIGGLLGYWLRDGGDVWRAQLKTESANYVAYRAAAEAREAQRDARISQLERAYLADTGTAAPRSPVAAADDSTSPELGTAEPAADAPSAFAAPSAALASGAGVAASTAIAATAHHDAGPDPEPRPADAAADTAPTDTSTPQHIADRSSDPMPDDVFVADDLTRIRSIDDDLASNLEALGVHRFSDIETMSAIDELALEQRLKLPAGYITAEQWRLQAALLAADTARAQGIGREPPSEA